MTSWVRDYAALLEDLDDLADRVSVFESRDAEPSMRIPLEKVKAELGLSSPYPPTRYPCLALRAERRVCDGTMEIVGGDRRHGRLYECTKCERRAFE